MESYADRLIKMSHSDLLESNVKHELTYLYLDALDFS